jgi:hypothetical protein
VAESGAQPGNNNAGKNKPFWRALDKAIIQEDGKRLRAAAEKLLDLAAQGEQWAVKELADRMDGKAAQVIAGDAENPLTLINKVERVIVHTKD